MFLVSCTVFLWRFQSLETEAPTYTAERLLNLANFLSLPRVPRHSASEKSKPDSLRRSTPKMVEIACL